MKCIIALAIALVSTVSAEQISLPSGPGSIQGLGAAFEPSLNTGGASYSVAFDGPVGRVASGPALSLSYSSGSGYDISGLGWSLNIPKIERSLEQGQPLYNADDSFQINGQRLIALTSGVYAPQIQGKLSFPVKTGDNSGPLNIRFKKQGKGWLAYDSNGYQYEFAIGEINSIDLKDGGSNLQGRLLTGRSGPNTDEFDTTYSWYLSKVISPLGHETDYIYQTFSGSEGKIYPAFVRYNVNASDNSNRIVFSYEQRSDSRTDYQAGFLRRTNQRLSTVETFQGLRKVHQYRLQYQPQSLYSGLSLLQSVTEWNADQTKQLPPLSFNYSELPAAAAQSIAVTDNLPAGVDIKNGLGLWLDMDADGLTDWLYYIQGQYYWAKNIGQELAANGQQKAPVAFAAAQAVLGMPSTPLSSDRLHQADLDGDGASDLLYRISDDTWSFYRNQRDGSFAPAVAYPAPASLVPGSPGVRFADVNFDQRMDLVAGRAGHWYYCLNGAADRNTDNIAIQTGLQNPYDQDMPPYGNFPGPEDIDHNGNRKIDLPRWHCSGALSNNIPGTFELTAPDIQLQDMNGDRLDDLVRIRVVNEKIEVGYYPQTGKLNFAAWQVIDFSEVSHGPSAVGVNPDDLQLRDINGDGLSDLLHIRSGQVMYWLQQGNSQWAEAVVLQAPAYNKDSVVNTSADLNGNGTQDLIWLSTDSTEDVKWLDISAPAFISESDFLKNKGYQASKANLLVEINNGMGSRTVLSYQSSGEHAARANHLDQAWQQNSPLIQHMVVSRRTLLTVDATGEGIDDDVIQYYRYRDPYYDPYRKQFRGFAFARVETQANPELSAGDADITRPVSRHYFYTGAPDGKDNDGDGRIDERDLDGSTEELPLLGMTYRKEQTAAHISLADNQEAEPEQLYSVDVQDWRVLRQHTIDSALASLNGLEVSLALMKQSQHLRYELQAQGKTRIQDISYNEFGKPTLVYERGFSDVADDDSTVESQYATHANGLFQQLSYKATRDHAGALLAAERYWFDYQGAQGEFGSSTLTRGLTTQQDAWEKENSWLMQSRIAYSEDGNPLTITDGDGRTRTLEWDYSWRTFPVTEQIYTQGPGGILTVRADYDTALGTLLRYTDSNGGVSHLTYDDFARITHIQRPYDHQPSTVYSYEQVDAFRGISYVDGVVQSQGTYDASRITTTLYRDDGQQEQQWTLFDGAGRQLAMVRNAEQQGYVFSDVKRYDHQGRIVAEYRPYFLPALSDFEFPDAEQNQGNTEKLLDALGRSTLETLPADEFGQRANISYQYFPYRFRQSDADGFKHEQFTDYAERVVKVGQPVADQNRDAPQFDYHQFTYDAVGRLLTRTDPLGNMKQVKFDGLGRKIWQHDLDQGTSSYHYDNAGNLISKTDGLGRTLEYKYDGSSRLLSVSDISNAGLSASSYPVSAGVTGGKLLYRYSYDKPHNKAPPSFKDQSNQLKGRLTAVEYFAHLNKDADHSLANGLSNAESSAEFYHYDLRGNRTGKAVWQQQRYYQFDYTFDAQDRMQTLHWPDGDSLLYRYNLRGLVQSVAGIVDEVSYAADGQFIRLDYAGGSSSGSSSQQRDYDNRGRLTRLLSQANTSAQTSPLLSLSYRYNQRGFIENINNGLSSEHAQKFNYDAKGQLSFARSHYGSLNYGYDAIGNMTGKEHQLLAGGNGKHQLGAVVYGYKQQRLQKEHNGNPDAPGPHAPLSSADGHQWQYNGVGQRTETLKPDGSRHIYLWDVMGRLSEWRLMQTNGSISRKEHYTYDPESRRLSKRSCRLENTAGDDDPANVSEFRCKQVYYLDGSYELRDSQYTTGIQKHIKLGSLRVARIELPQLQAQNQLAQHTLSLNPGWNPVFLQVDPQGNNVYSQLGDTLPKIKEIIGFDAENQRYEHYQRDQLTAGQLNHLQGQRAYWFNIDALEFFDWRIENQQNTAELQQSRIVKPGWNWRELPLTQSVSVADFVEYNPAITSIWAYDSSVSDPQLRWTFWDPRVGDDVSTLKQLSPHSLYWLQAEQELPLTDPLAGIKGQHFALHNDHIGSVTLTLDSNNQVIQHSHYQPYGAAANLQLTSLQPYGFSGKERDDSGLLYFEARYYDPLSGRFISPDPLFGEQMDKCLSSVIECNLYQYTGNNPVMFVDAFGFEKTVFISVGLGASLVCDVCNTLEKYEGTVPQIISMLDLGAASFEGGVVLEFADVDNDPKTFYEKLMDFRYDSALLGLGFMGSYTFDGEAEGHVAGVAKSGLSVAVWDGYPEDRESYKSAMMMYKGKVANIYFDDAGSMKGFSVSTGTGYGASKSTSHDGSLVMPLTPNTQRGRGVLNSLLELTNSFNHALGHKGVDIDRGEPSGGF